MIYLIRHAESEANITHVFGTDAPLSFKGRVQAINARKTYGSINFDKIYSSTKARTKQTATLIFHGPIPKERQLPEFDEIWFGDAEGKASTRTGIEGYKNQYRDNFIAFMAECRGDDPYERADKAITKLREIAITNPQDRIAIITSDTLMRCIMQTLRHEHNWNDISSVEHINNLDSLCFSISSERMDACLIKQKDLLSLESYNK